MILVSSCVCLCPIFWSRVLNREWRCSWSSADRRCSYYIWVINNLIAYKGAPYIRDLTVHSKMIGNKLYLTRPSNLFVSWCHVALCDLWIHYSVALIGHAFGALAVRELCWVDATHFIIDIVTTKYIDNCRDSMINLHYQQYNGCSYF